MLEQYSDIVLLTVPLSATTALNKESLDEGTSSKEKAAKARKTVQGL